MDASSTRLAILTVGVEEPVPSGQEHWHCCQSASAKTPKVTSRCWIVPVSADESPAASRKHCQKRQFSTAYIPGYSRASAVSRAQQPQVASATASNDSSVYLSLRRENI